jgi:hypothetical protein
LQMFQENFRDDLSLNAIAVERMLQTNKILAVNIDSASGSFRKLPAIFYSAA